jgi:hypothetical protein
LILIDHWGVKRLAARSMKDVTENNFGVIIAFLLPGFLFLWGLSFSNNDVATWLTNMSSKDAPQIGSFLYTTVASLALGLLIDAIRGAVIDEIFYRFFNLEWPAINSSKLKNKDTLAAFNAAIQNHYRYYQYYANSVVAVAAAFAAYVIAGKSLSAEIAIPIGALLLILLYVSYDELKSFNERAKEITR